MYKELELSELEKLGVYLVNGRLIFVANELFKNGYSNKRAKEVAAEINKVWYICEPGRPPILTACRKVAIVVYEDVKVKWEAQFPLIIATISVLLSLAVNGMGFKAITVYCEYLTKTSRKVIAHLLSTIFPQVGRRVMVEYRFHLVIKNPTIDLDMMFIDYMRPSYIRLRHPVI